MRKIMLLIILCFCISQFSFAADHQNKKNVLVLHSYSPSYMWSENIQNGIESVLDNSIHEVQYYFEYMDTKTLNQEDYYNKLFDLYSLKYKDINFDGIIVSDNNALNFIIEHQDDLAKDTPIIAIGINNVMENMLHHENITIVVEKPSYKETLDFAMRQNPKASTINIIIDKTNTSLLIRDEITEILNENYVEDYTIKWIDSWSLDKIVDCSRDLTENDILLFVLYFQDADGEIYIDNDSVNEIVRNSAVPTYVLWDFQMNTGAFGGHVISGFNHGKKGSELLLEHWSGIELPVVYSRMDELNQFVIDYRVSKLFDIDETFFTNEVEFINKEPTYYEENSFLIWTLIITTLLSITIILLLLSTLNRKTQILKKDKQLNYLRKQVIQSRHEVLSVLTNEEKEVIRDTQEKHHKRVGEICYLLAQLSGLDTDKAKNIRDCVPFCDTNSLELLDRLDDFSKAELHHFEFHIPFKNESKENQNPDTIKLASLISLQSKEKWNGSGFPLGLKETQSHIASRIFKLADMCDSLMTETKNKPGWELREVNKYLQSEKAHTFDPTLVDMLLSNIDTIMETIEKKI